jgi:4-amino-4-deoxy-L-arabinose transferase-like glycosyltransferase
MENEYAVKGTRSWALPRAYSLSAGGALILISLIYAHLKVAASGESYSGLLAPVDRFFDLILALGLTTVAFGVGRALSRRLSLEFANRAEELSLSILLGTGTVGLGVFMLGIAGMLSPAPVAALIILFIVLSRREIAIVFNAAAKWFCCHAPLASKRQLTALLFNALCLSLFLIITSTPTIYDPAPLLSVFIAGVAILLGFLLSKRSAPAFTPPCDLPLTFLIGACVTALCVVGLSSIGLFSSTSVAGFLILCAVVSRREMTALYNALSREFLHYRVASGRRQTIVLLLAPLFFIMLLRTATPPHVFDEALYHLSATKLFVEHGRLYPLYDNAPANMPFLIHMLYAVCLMAKSDIAAKLFSLMLALSTALLIYGFCLRFLTRRTGVLALFGFFGAGMVVEVAVTTRIDISLAGMLFATTYAMMVYLENNRPNWLYLSAVLAGFSLGIKLTAVTWLAPVGCMFLFESLYRRRGLLLIKRGLIYLVIAAAIASPWHIKNYVWFDNPVYPFLTGEVAAYGPGARRFFNQEDDRKLNAYLDLSRREIPEDVKAIENSLERASQARIEHHPLRIWEYFSDPDSYGVAEFNDYPNYLFLALPLLIFVRKRRWVIWALAISACFFLCLSRNTWIARYWLPMFPALTIAAAYALTELTDRLKPYRLKLAQAIAPVVVAMSLIPVINLSLRELQQTGGLSYIAGALARAEFMGQTIYYPSIDFVNHQLPPKTRLLMMGAQMGYDLQRPYLADASWDSIEWNRTLLRNGSLEEVHADLKRQGVTHVLFNPNLYSFVTQIGLDIGPTAGTPSHRIGVYRPAAFLEGGHAIDGDRDFGEALTGSEPEYHVQLRSLATFELYRKKFLEQLYIDRYGYQVYQLK